MYTQEVPRIMHHGLGSLSGFEDVVMFGVLSARTPLLRLPVLMREVKRHGRNAVGLTPAKRDAHDYLQIHGPELYDWVHSYRLNTQETLLGLCRVPGLALVKAGFVAQMLGHDVGCIDMHNAERLGFVRKDYRLDKKTTWSNWRARAQHYIKLCRSKGSAQWWWDGWCEYMTTQQEELTTADEVSKYHLAVLGI